MADKSLERRKTFEQWQAFEEKQQERELEDLAFYDGEQWPQSVKDLWGPVEAVGGRPALPASPMLTINKTREPIRHVINEERASELGVEIVASDDFGPEQNPITPEEIDLREGLVRRIQRESYAIDARIWAAERAVIAGRGYYGVMTRYLPGKTNDQEIYIRSFYNQGAILLDPAHNEPDGSDTEGAFVPVWMPWEQYKATYPRRAGKVSNPNVAMDSAEFQTLAEQRTKWFSTQNDKWRVRVVEYWYYERTTRGLATLKNGMIGWEDELTEEGRDAIEDVREINDKAVKWCLLDGFDDQTPLEETDWEGKYIPIIKIVGEQIQPYDEQRRFEGMIRPARDSQRGSNYMISKLVKKIGFEPNSPLMMTPGHIEGYSDMYTSMAVRAWPVLFYNATDPTTGQPLPEPMRPPVQTDIAATAAAYQMFNEAIKSTTAVPDATLGNVDPTVRSGKGIQALALNALKATAHFGDNYTRSLNYEGRILNDLLYPIYGIRQGRRVQIYKDRKSASVMIGQPQAQGMSANAVPPQAAAILTPDVNFNVTIKITKNYDTLKEQEASTVMEAVAAAPEWALPLFGDKIFETQSGPGHKELAERATFGLRPDVQAMLQAKKTGQPEPNAQMQQLLAENQQLKQMIQAKTPELQAKAQIAQMQEQHDDARTAAELQQGMAKAELQASAQLAVAQAKVDAENFRSYVDALEGKIAKTLDLHMQTVADHLNRLHEHLVQGKDHAHEAALTAMEHAHERQLAGQQHEQALEQGQQQAALEPDPVTE